MMAAASAGLAFPRLRLPRLEPGALTPTRFHSAEDKASFGNQLLTFIADGMTQVRFTKALYQQLSNTFGHIAHYDLSGFWNEFFTCTAKRIAFLEQTLQYPCYGLPEHTFCDVERLIQRRIDDAQLLPAYRAVLARQIVDAERAELRRLQAKYQPAADVPSAVPARVPEQLDLLASQRQVSRLCGSQKDAEVTDVK